jgi:hypothetical protein
MWYHFHKLRDDTLSAMQRQGVNGLPPLSLPHFQAQRDAFLAQTEFKNGFVTLPDYRGESDLWELLREPHWFECFIFSREAMAILAAIMLEERECHRHERLWTACLKRFQDYGVTEAELDDYILHFLSHISDSWVIDWKDTGWSVKGAWERQHQIAAEHASPYAEAYAFMRLLPEYNWDLTNPLILDAYAELTFDPRNVAWFEAWFHRVLSYRGENPRVQLALLETSTATYLRTGGKPEEWVDYEELRTRPYTKVQWLVDGLCAKGSMSILLGDAKAGKSNLVRNLLYSLTTGDTWLGRSCRPVPVAYFRLEDPEEVFIEAMERLYNREGARPRLGPSAPLKVQLVFRTLH